ncbi:MAG: ferredoxin--NADP reductase [Anaerosomatales bacterium]
MASHEVAVIGQEARCSDVLSVRFERPPGYTFAAGQYLALTLRTAQGRETKPFSHSSGTGDPHLEVTTRLSGSTFKAALSALEPGDRVSIAGPAGRLTIPADERRVAFLVGGVGITPVISMLRSRDPATAPETVLFYGNRESSCIPFADEIAALAGERLSVVHVVEEAPEEWRGERGFITPRIVRGRLDPSDGWLFVVAGPPVMVSAMEAVLDALAVPASRAMIERFGPPA